MYFMWCTFMGASNQDSLEQHVIMVVVNWHPFQLFHPRSYMNKNTLVERLFQLSPCRNETGKREKTNVSTYQNFCLRSHYYQDPQPLPVCLLGKTTNQNQFYCTFPHIGMHVQSAISKSNYEMLVHIVKYMSMGRKRL